MPKADARAARADDEAPADDDGASGVVRLLGAFDPFLLGYRGYGHVVAEEHVRKVWPGGGWIHPVVLVDGVAAGTWRLDGPRLGVDAFGAIPGEGLEAEAQDVARFLAASSPSRSRVLRLGLTAVAGRGRVVGHVAHVRGPAVRIVGVHAGELVVREPHRDVLVQACAAAAAGALLPAAVHERAAVGGRVALPGSSETVPVPTIQIASSAAAAAATPAARPGERVSRTT